MEYTKSVDRNGEVFETFEGTPEEIARLIRLMDRDYMGGNGIKIHPLLKTHHQWHHQT